MVQNKEIPIFGVNTALEMFWVHILQQSFETTTPSRPGNSGVFNFSVCKALVNALQACTVLLGNSVFFFFLLFF